MADWYSWDKLGLVINIHVQTRASRNEISGVHDDALKVRITSPPVDGKANKQLVRFMAEQCGVPRTSVQIISGQTSRHKRLLIPVENKQIPKKLLSYL